MEASKVLEVEKMKRDDAITNERKARMEKARTVRVAERVVNTTHLI